MTDINAKNWDNYWQGRASQKSGNALVGVGIEQSQDLKNFWTEFFSSKSKSISVIDFACGAGSVLEHAKGLGIAELTGLDVSEKALQVLAKKLPGTKTTCAPVDKTGLKSNTYDIAVSQFGIEYAGTKDQLSRAFTEMYRIIKPGGELVVLAHSLEGFIVEGCQASLQQIKLVEESGFIIASKNVLLALHNNTSQRGNPAEFDAMTRQLNASAEPIMTWLKSSNVSAPEQSSDKFSKFAYHLLESSHRLITHYENYSKAESIEWFEGIEHELLAYKGRMLSMTKAALSKQDISELEDRLKAEKTTAKMSFEMVDVMHFDANPKPAAWIIRAQKPQ